MKFEEFTASTGVWISGNGKREIFQDIVDAISQENFREIYVGCDSKKFKNYITYVCAICIKGTSCYERRYFYKLLKFSVNHHNLSINKIRLRHESSISLMIANYLKDHLTNKSICIHLDLQKESSIYPDVVNYAKSLSVAYGFECKLKPNAWAATCVADRHTRP